MQSLLVRFTKLATTRRAHARHMSAADLVRLTAARDAAADRNRWHGVAAMSGAARLTCA